MSAHLSQSWKLYCLLPVLFVTAYLAYNAPSVLSNSAVPKLEHENAFVLLVNLEFASEEDKSAFLIKFKPMAKYVRDHEPTTLTYTVAESDKDSKLVVIMERYVNKAAYLDIHKTSAQFISFRQELSNFGDRVKITGNSFIELGL